MSPATIGRQHANASLFFIFPDRIFIIQFLTHRHCTPLQVTQVAHPKSAKERISHSFTIFAT